MGALVINREILIPNREIGRLSLLYQKSGDLPQNRETWKLCQGYIAEARKAKVTLMNILRLRLLF